MQNFSNKQGENKKITKQYSYSYSRNILPFLLVCCTREKTHYTCQKLLAVENTANKCNDLAKTRKYINYDKSCQIPMQMQVSPDMLSIKNHAYAESRQAGMRARHDGSRSCIQVFSAFLDLNHNTTISIWRIYGHVSLPFIAMETQNTGI